VLTALEKALGAPVAITRDGKSFTVIRLEAAMESLVGKAPSERRHRSVC